MDGVRHVIIAGFGVPGRYLAELLDERKVPYVVIEQNPATAERCTTVRIITGDARDEAVLKRAGIANAMAVALTLPNEHVVQETVSAVRRLRPEIRVIARCNYVSGGFKAQQLGADGVIVAEQLVAQAFYRDFEGWLGKDGRVAHESARIGTNEEEARRA